MHSNLRHRSSCIEYFINMHIFVFISLNIILDWGFIPISFVPTTQVLSLYPHKWLMHSLCKRIYWLYPDVFHLYASLDAQRVCSSVQCVQQEIQVSLFSHFMATLLIMSGFTRRYIVANKRRAASFTWIRAAFLHKIFPPSVFLHD